MDEYKIWVADMKAEQEAKKNTSNMVTNYGRVDDKRRDCL